MANYDFFQNKACEYFPCHQGADPETFSCLFCYCPLYALGDQCGGKGLEEGVVFSAERFGLPTEDTLVFAVHIRHDLGCVSCAPLGEEMGYLKVLDTNSVAHIHPSVKKLEVEGVSAVCSLYTNELGRESLAANRGVKRKGENRGEKHIYAALDRHSCKVFYDLPMPLRPNRDIIILGKAVGVEPLGVHKLLLGKGRTDDLDLNRAACGFFGLARAEGYLPAPESSHAIRVAIDEAMKCKETGEEKTILFGLTGTGYFDMVAYQKFNDGVMSDYIPTDADLQQGFDGLPDIEL